MKLIKQHHAYLQVLANANPKMRRVILQNSSPQQIHALVQVIVNILLGNVPISSKQKQKIAKYKNSLRKLLYSSYNKQKNKVINRKNNKKMIIQTGGFLPILLTPLLALATKAAIGGAIGAGAGYATKKIIEKATQ